MGACSRHTALGRMAKHRAYECNTGGLGGVWHKASVSDCLPLAAPIGLLPLLILTLCGSERVVGGFGHFLLLAHISQSVLGVVACCKGGGGG